MARSLKIVLVVVLGTMVLSAVMAIGDGDTGIAEKAVLAVIAVGLVAVARTVLRAPVRRRMPS